MPKLKTTTTPPLNSEDRELTVYVEKSYTTKLHNGDFVKVVIGCTLPFYPTPATRKAAKEAIVRASEVVDEMIADEITRIE